jgi:hypothetical protein
MKILFILIMTLSQSVFATSAKDVKNKAGETVDTATEYTKEQKEAFTKEMEENLATLKAKIKEMKAKTGKSKDATVAKLEKEQKDLEHDLAAMKKSSGRAWDKLKNGVSKAWDDVKSSMNEASGEFKK